MTLKPHIAAEAGFVPCAVSGTMTLSRCVSPRSWKYFLAISSAASSACAPADGLSENAAMPKSELERALELVHHLQRALRELVGRERMQLRELGLGRHRVVDARVVLHRARSERIEAEIDAERAAARGS